MTVAAARHDPMLTHCLYGPFRWRATRCQCSCGWRSAAHMTVINACLAFGQHLPPGGRHMTRHVQTTGIPPFIDGGCLVCDECDRPDGHAGACDCMCDAIPRERSCPRTSPMKGPAGWCDYPLMPHEWINSRDGIRYWCPGYWDECEPSQPAPHSSGGVS